MPEEPVTSPQRYLTYEQMNLINDFRYQNLSMGLWGRALIISLKYNLPNADATYARLLQIPTAVYEKLSTFYGKESAEQYVNLLTQYLITFHDLILALKAGDSSGATAALQRWYQNADDISTFFAQLNPYWDREHWRNLLYQFNQMIYEHIMAILTEQFDKEIQINDRILYHTALIADYQSRGLLQNLATVPEALRQPSEATSISVWR